jgi:pimeloyl-ACP methyl ester carboxylesterase
MPEVNVNGQSISYAERGRGLPLVLVHGFPLDNRIWESQIANLSDKYRVIAPDLPGFGASDAPASPYNPPWFAAWVEAFQTATHSRGAVLIGNSLGGRIALEAGLAHPKSVRGLVLLTPSPAFRRLRQWVPLVRVASPELARLPMPPLNHRLTVEGIKAMAEIAASDIAIRKRTEKLRALRLAKEAHDLANPPEPKAKPKAKAKVAKKAEVK